MSDNAADWFKDNTLCRDLYDIVTGEWLGRGSAREVWTFAPDPTLVIKFEVAARSFQNVAEWETWSWINGTTLKKWFAPCVKISSCGTVLLQRRVEPIRVAEQPRRLPAFLSDLKRENFGIFEGRLVCCDYGTVQSAIRTVPRGLKRAQWA